MERSYRSQRYCSSMRCHFFYVLAFILLEPLTVIASTVVVKPGDTLSEIASRNNVPLSELIRLNRIKDSSAISVGQKLLLPNKENTKSKPYTIKRGDTLSKISLRFGTNRNELVNINGIRDIDYLYEGQIIKIPIKAAANSSNQKNEVNKIHTVKSGETIGSIAIQYNTNKALIISLNNLSNPNNIYPGQLLKIESKASSKPKMNLIKKDSDFHLVKEGETLSYISNLYNISLDRILELNKIKNANSIKPGKKLYLRSKNVEYVKLNTNNKSDTKKKPKRHDWRTYGPLKVDWTSWRKIGGSYVTATTNNQGQSLYLAVNCTARKINATGINGTWKNWIEPVDKFEYQIIEDLCKTKKS